MKFNEEVGKKIKSARNDARLSLKELGEMVGLSDATVQRYEAGKIKGVDINLLKKIAAILDVSPAYLMGWDEEEATTDRAHAIPVLGSIPAGVPIEAVEDVVGRVVIPEEWTKHGDEFFALRVSGDSMYPLFLDGDTVIIRRQACANSGDICACYVNGFDATLKRIKLTEHSITLQPENTNYAPATYTHPGEVTIAGVVVESRRNFKRRG